MQHCVWHSSSMLMHAGVDPNDVWFVFFICCVWVVCGFLLTPVCDSKHYHSDVIKWDTFSVLLASCVGNPPVTGEFPAQRPVTQSFDVFFDLRLTKRVSKKSWGWWFETPLYPSWRRCNDSKIRSLVWLELYCTRNRITNVSGDVIYFVASFSIT